MIYHACCTSRRRYTGDLAHTVEQAAYADKDVITGFLLCGRGRGTLRQRSHQGLLLNWRSEGAALQLSKIPPLKDSAGLGGQTAN